MNTSGDRKIDYKQHAYENIENVTCENTHRDYFGLYFLISAAVTQYQRQQISSSILCLWFYSQGTSIDVSHQK
jgi:hypothetical protein